MRRKLNRKSVSGFIKYYLIGTVLAFFALISFEYIGALIFLGVSIQGFGYILTTVSNNPLLYIGTPLISPLLLSVAIFIYKKIMPYTPLWIRELGLIHKKLISISLIMFLTSVIHIQSVVSIREVNDYCEEVAVEIHRQQRYQSFVYIEAVCRQEVKRYFDSFEEEADISIKNFRAIKQEYRDTIKQKIREMTENEL